MRLKIFPMDFIINRNKKTTEIDFEKTIQTLDELVKKEIPINFTMNISYEISIKDSKAGFAQRLLKYHFTPQEGYKITNKFTVEKLKTKTKYKMQISKTELKKPEENTSTYNPIRNLLKISAEIKYQIPKK